MRFAFPQLVTRDQGDDRAAGAGARGAARPVGVVLLILRRIEVQERRRPSRRGCRERRRRWRSRVDLAASEAIQGVLTLALRTVAVDGPRSSGRLPRASSPPGRCRAWSCRTRWSAPRCGSRRPSSSPLLALDLPEEMGGPRPILVGLGKQVTYRVLLVAAHQGVDRTVEGGGEEQRLTGRRRPVEQVLDRGRNPMSAMRSASSTTTTSTWSRSTSPRSMRSVRRPGQATSTSTPRRSAFSCRPKPAPP